MKINIKNTLSCISTALIITEAITRLPEATTKLSESILDMPGLTKYKSVIYSSEESESYYYISRFLAKVKLPCLDKAKSKTNKLNSDSRCEFILGSYSFIKNKTKITFRFSETEGNHSTKKKQIFIIFTGKNSEHEKDIMLAAIHQHKTKETLKKSMIFTTGGPLMTTVPRDLSFIFQHKLDELIQYLDNFTSPETRDLYASLNQVYKTGVLLYGEPGCGKSSIILGLQHRYNALIIFVDLSKGDWEYDLHWYLRNIPKDKFMFLCLEDIDLFINGTRRDNKEKTDEQKEKDRSEKEAKVGKLFNILDGYAAQDRVITFITTNHIKSLDPALIRYGRVDYKFKSHLLDRELCEKMVEAYGLTMDDIHDVLPEEIKPSVFRQYLLDIRLGTPHPLEDYDKYNEDMNI